MFKCGFIIVYLLVLVTSEELKKQLSKNRQAKFVSFKPEGEDVEVGLDFSIPFIKIPIKKTFNAVGEFGLPGINLPKININPVAIVLGGMIIAFTSVFGPLVNKVFDWHHLDRSSRGNDEISNFTSLFITEGLLANSRGCPEKIACWTGKRNKNTDIIHTWKQIISNELLSTMVNTTALKEATLKGLKGQDCEHYTPCPIDENMLPKLIKNFAILTNSNYL